MFVRELAARANTHYYVKPSAQILPISYWKAFVLLENTPSPPAEGTPPLIGLTGGMYYVIMYLCMLRQLVARALSALHCWCGDSHVNQSPVSPVVILASINDRE
jgi:hypothetical protein